MYTENKFLIIGYKIIKYFSLFKYRIKKQTDVRGYGLWLKAVVPKVGSFSNVRKWMECVAKRLAQNRYEWKEFLQN